MIVEGKSEQLDQLISDYGSGLYGTFFSIGQILAPIVGGALFEAVGYRQTTDFMTLVCLGWCIVFFVFNVGFKIYSQESKIHEKMELLAELHLEQQDDELAKRLAIQSGVAGDAATGNKHDEDDQEEEIEEFLKKQREKWKQIREQAAGKNDTHQKNGNTLSLIRESKNETFLESRLTSEAPGGDTSFLKPNS